MKSNKQLQSEFKKRKRESGLIRKDIWVFKEDWPHIKEVVSELTKKRLDIITGND